MQGNISLLKKENSKKLEEFLVFIFGEMLRDAAQKSIQCMFSEDYRHPSFLICQQENDIIAAAAISEEFFTVNTWGISWVAVHPDFRNQGLGQKIVEACLAIIAQKVLQPVTAILATLPGQTQLYERVGFKGTTTDYEGGFILTRTVEPYHAS